MLFATKRSLSVYDNFNLKINLKRNLQFSTLIKILDVYTFYNMKIVQGYYFEKLFNFISY